MSSANTFYTGLLEAQQLYAACGFTCTTPVAEAESAEYGAFTFRLGTLAVTYRVAKITPTKTGQFVTLWKRQGKGPIQPFDISDRIDLFIISASNGVHSGQFIFTAGVLLDKGILSGHNKEGKRAMRIYPPWDVTNSKQAQKTQLWQLDYFVPFYKDKPANQDLVKKLLLAK